MANNIRTLNDDAIEHVTFDFKISTVGSEESGSEYDPEEELGRLVAVPRRPPQNRASPPR